ncbi:hypothetical protein ACOSP7_020572 [Xanthoceras sorbifolium]
MVNQTRVCILMPPRIQSVGLASELFGNETATYNWYDYSLPRFELHIALIFIVAQIFHFFLKRLGVPLFISQLIAGLTLSQAVLQDKSSTVWTDKGVQVLGTVGAFGYSFFMFLIGVKMDPSLITRANKSTLTIGILSVIAPLLCAMPVILLSFDPISERGPKFQTFFLSACYAVTSFPAIFVLLGELKILNSELGRIALSSAITGDLLSLFMLIVGNVLNVLMQDGGTAALNELALVVAFLAVVFLVLRPGMLMAIRYTPEGKAVTETCIFVVFLLFLACVPLIQWSNFMPLAPYILGLAIPHGPPLGSTLVEKFESMVNNLFLPLFVANVALVVVALVVKLIACFLPSYLSRMPTMDALALAFIMSTKGIIDMGMFTFFFDEAIIDQKMFGFTFYVVLYTATIVPVVVKYLYDPTRRYAGYNKRSLMHWKPYSELPIVSVIHVPDNVASVINLLEASCPTKENPMDVNVLHLIKLSGQANPIFISHQRKRRTSSTTASYSQNLIISFNKFKGNNWGAVSVNAFTAVSPPDLMHDDICNLALDRLACLIILPFHRRWYIDGSIESDNDYIRALKARVLEKAPCSVGIFIDRDNLQRRAPMPVDSSLEAPSYKVAIVFLGGSDDREALTLSKRMSRDNRVALTVVRLTAQNGNEEWNSMLESEMLREMKSNGYINYMEKGVADGPETAMIVRSMVTEFDLIIVGRRYNLESPQTSGLKEWSEFPELGVLGDLLASVDNHSGRCSVLIVQQEEIVVSSKLKMDMFP